MGHPGLLSQGISLKLLAANHSQMLSELASELTNRFPQIAWEAVPLDQYQPEKNGHSSGLQLLLLPEQEDQRQRVIQGMRHWSAPLIVVGQEESRETILQLFRAGARDYLDWRSEGAAGLQRVLQAAWEGLQGTIASHCCIGVLGSGGGAGTTCLTANLGVLLSQPRQSTRLGQTSSLQKTRSTLLIDIARNAGDLATYLNLHPEHALNDLIDSNLASDAELLRQSSVCFNEHLSLIAARDRMESQTEMTSEALVSMLHAARQDFDCLLLDLGGRSAEFLAELQAKSDLLIAPFQANLVSVKRMRFLLQGMKEAGISEEKIILVENRHHREGNLSTNQIEKIFKKSIQATIPEHTRGFSDAVNRGVPLCLDDPRNPATKALQVLADMLRTRVFGEQPLPTRTAISGIRRLAACWGVL